MTSPCIQPTARSRAGFTLIELMAVIIVLGMIAGTVSVSWKALVPRAQLNSQVRELASTLQSTRSEAITRKQEFWIEYNLDEDWYRVHSPFHVEGRLMSADDDEEDRLALARHQLPRGVEIASVYLEGEEFSEQSVFVHFDPLGAASDHAVVFVQPDFETFYTIEVLALTGLIRFHQGIFSREPPRDEDFQ